MRCTFILFITGFTALLPLRGSAQRSFDPDTLLYTLPEHIIVTALRLSVTAGESPAPMDIIGAKELHASPAESVSDIIARSPGAALRSYGAGGSLDLISLRGLDAEYTTILLNGIRLNTAQNSSVDLDKIPLCDVQQIEIARGGYSSLYGADALGGIINIRTSDAVSAPFLQASAGSFGYRQYEGGAGLRAGIAAFSLTGYYEEAQNDYPFTARSNGKDATRARSNYTKRGLSLRSSLAGNTTTAALYILANNTNAGTPGALTGVSQGYARQIDRTINVSAPVRSQTSASLLVQFTPFFNYGWENYYDPKLMINGKATDAIYENIQYGASLTAEHAVQTSLKLLYGAETQFATLHSEEVSGTPQRLSAGLFVTGEWTVDTQKRLRVTPSIRGDMHRELHTQTNNSRISPSLALQYRLLPEALTLRTRASAGYRIPTFNQLYWAEGGNPNVRPETSTSLDGGFTWTPQRWTGFSLDAGYFRQDIIDKIVWRPSSGVYWSPINIRNVVSNGIETSLTYATQRFRADLNAQWVSSRQVNEDFPGDEKKDKQLLYVPEFSGSLRAFFQPLRTTSIAVTGSYIGKRYYTSTNDSWLDPYTTIDAAITQHVTIEGVSIALKGEILNAFDTEYEVTAFYPMPGRSFRISLTTQFPHILRSR